MSPSSVKPRHVLCFLGKDESLLHPPKAVAKTIIDFGFEIDRTYSQAQPDPHMTRSFGVCWDRVFPNAWSAADEAAVANHKSVLYVLSPPMEQQKAVAYSAAALRIIEELIEAGATAVKGESAGVAHGLKRWVQLAAECKAAAKTNQGLALTAAMGRTCRLAFAKRPLGGAAYNESVGFHLVGLPEVYVAKARSSDRDAARLIDEIADAMAERGIDATLADRKLSLAHDSAYAEDRFKFNPYGIVHVDYAETTEISSRRGFHSCIGIRRRPHRDRVPGIPSSKRRLDFVDGWRAPRVMSCGPASRRPARIDTALSGSRHRRCGLMYSRRFRPAYALRRRIEPAGDPRRSALGSPCFRNSVTPEIDAMRTPSISRWRILPPTSPLPRVAEYAAQFPAPVGPRQRPRRRPDLALMVEHCVKEYRVERTVFERKRRQIGFEKGEICQARTRRKAIGGGDRIRLDVNADQRWPTIPASAAREVVPGRGAARRAGSCPASGMGHGKKAAESPPRFASAETP